MRRSSGWGSCLRIEADGGLDCGASGTRGDSRRLHFVRWAFGGWVSDCAAAGCAGECGRVVSAAGFGADDAAAAGAGDRQLSWSCAQGDLVVHLAHGIGRYRGLRLLEKDGRAEEHLELEYNGGTKIYVPAAKIELVQKYVGGKGARRCAREHRRQGVGEAEGGGAEGGYRSGGGDDRAAGGARCAAGHCVSDGYGVAARVRCGVSVSGDAGSAHVD